MNIEQIKEKTREKQMGYNDVMRQIEAQANAGYSHWVNNQISEQCVHDLIREGFNVSQKTDYAGIPVYVIQW